MTVLKVVALLALFVAAAGAAQQVEELTYANITQVYRGDWLLVLYSPWCGHCKRVQQMLPSVARRVEPPTRVARADIEANPALQVQFAVTGVPVLLRLHDGAVREYSGDRGEEQLVAWVDHDYAEAPPLSHWTGPTSLLKRALGAYAHVVLWLYALATALAERLGVSPVMVASVFAGAVVLLSIVIAVSCSMRSNAPLPPPKPKAKPAAAAPEAATAAEKKKKKPAEKPQQQQQQQQMRQRKKKQETK